MNDIGERRTLREVWDQLDSYRAVPAAHGYPTNVVHLFAPVDRVHDALVALTGAARISLAAALYGWDDEAVDGIFRDKLQSQHVTVLLTLDKTQAAGVHERTILARWPPSDLGNEILVGQSAKHAISHDKMVVIDGLVTICGSTNFSDSGERKQNNEMVIVWDPVFAVEARHRIDLIASEMRAQMVAARA